MTAEQLALMSNTELTEFFCNMVVAYGDRRAAAAAAAEREACALIAQGHYRDIVRFDEPSYLDVCGAIAVAIRARAKPPAPAAGE